MDSIKPKPQNQKCNVYLSLYMSCIVSR